MAGPQHCQLSQSWSVAGCCQNPWVAVAVKPSLLVCHGHTSDQGKTLVVFPDRCPHWRASGSLSRWLSDKQLSFRFLSGLGRTSSQGLLWVSASRDKPLLAPHPCRMYWPAKDAPPSSVSLSRITFVFYVVPSGFDRCASVPNMELIGIF